VENDGISEMETEGIVDCACDGRDVVGTLVVEGFVVNVDDVGASDELTEGILVDCGTLMDGCIDTIAGVGCIDVMGAKLNGKTVGATLNGYLVGELDGVSEAVGCAVGGAEAAGEVVLAGDPVTGLNEVGHLDDG